MIPYNCIPPTAELRLHGYLDIAANERSDELARNGPVTAFVDPGPCIPSSLKQLIVKWKSNRFSNYWQSLSIATQPKKSNIKNKTQSYAYYSNINGTLFLE